MLDQSAPRVVCSVPNGPAPHSKGPCLSRGAGLLRSVGALLNNVHDLAGFRLD
jgi:hypothetical protein